MRPTSRACCGLRLRAVCVCDCGTNRTFYSPFGCCCFGLSASSGGASTPRQRSPALASVHGFALASLGAGFGRVEVLGLSFLPFVVRPFALAASGLPLFGSGVPSPVYSGPLQGHRSVFLMTRIVSNRHFFKQKRDFFEALRKFSAFFYVFASQDDRRSRYFAHSKFPFFVSYQRNSE